MDLKPLYDHIDRVLRTSSSWFLNIVDLSKFPLNKCVFNPVFPIFIRVLVLHKFNNSKANICINISEKTRFFKMRPFSDFSSTLMYSIVTCHSN
jgi:hypothetical protein